jgi:hypothetical protein
VTAAAAALTVAAGSQHDAAATVWCVGGHRGLLAGQVVCTNNAAALQVCTLVNSRRVVVWVMHGAGATPRVVTGAATITSGRVSFR